jgi:hypothetical protein
MMVTGLLGHSTMGVNFESSRRCRTRSPYIARRRKSYSRLDRRRSLHTMDIPERAQLPEIRCRALSRRGSQGTSVALLHLAVALRERHQWPAFQSQKSITTRRADCRAIMPRGSRTRQRASWSREKGLRGYGSGWIRSTDSPAERLQPGTSRTIVRKTD